MDQRSTIMNANMSGGLTVEPFLDVDLRDIFTTALLAVAASFSSSPSSSSRPRIPTGRPSR